MNLGDTLNLVSGSYFDIEIRLQRDELENVEALLLCTLPLFPTNICTNVI